MTLAGSQTSGILILDILEQVHEKIRASKNIPILRANRVPDTAQWERGVSSEPETDLGKTSSLLIFFSKRVFITADANRSDDSSTIDASKIEVRTERFIQQRFRLSLRWLLSRHSGLTRLFPDCKNKALLLIPGQKAKKPCFATRVPKQKSAPRLHTPYSRVPPATW